MWDSVRVVDAISISKGSPTYRIRHMPVFRRILCISHLDIQCGIVNIFNINFSTLYGYISWIPGVLYHTSSSHVSSHPSCHVHIAFWVPHMMYSSFCDLQGSSHGCASDHTPLFTLHTQYAARLGYDTFHGPVCICSATRFIVQRNSTAKMSL